MFFAIREPFRAGPDEGRSSSAQGRRAAEGPTRGAGAIPSRGVAGSPGRDEALTMTNRKLSAARRHRTGARGMLLSGPSRRSAERSHVPSAPNRGCMGYRQGDDLGRLPLAGLGARDDKRHEGGMGWEPVGARGSGPGCSGSFGGDCTRRGAYRHRKMQSRKDMGLSTGHSSVSARDDSPAAAIRPSWVSCLTN